MLRWLYNISVDVYNWSIEKTNRQKRDSLDEIPMDIQNAHIDEWNRKGNR